MAGGLTLRTAGIPSRLSGRLDLFPGCQRPTPGFVEPTSVRSWHLHLATLHLNVIRSSSTERYK